MISIKFEWSIICGIHFSKITVNFTIFHVILPKWVRHIMPKPPPPSKFREIIFSLLYNPYVDEINKETGAQVKTMFDTFDIEYA